MTSELNWRRDADGGLPWSSMTFGEGRCRGRRLQRSLRHLEVGV